MAYPDIRIQGHIIPASSNVYDLGSASSRFRDLYLTGNTIDLGGVLIERDGNSQGLAVLQPSGGLGNLSIQSLTTSNLRILGTFASASNLITEIQTSTDAIDITNDGTATALKVTQLGERPIIELYQKDLASFTPRSNVVFSVTSNQTNVNAIRSSGPKNYIRSHWDTFGDLESEAPPATYHGMFAHAHDTGRAYYAHSGAWTPIANLNEIPQSTDNLLEGSANLYYTNARVDTRANSRITALVTNITSIASTASNIVQRGANSEIYVGAISSSTISSSAQKNYIRAHWDTFADLETEAPPADFHGMFAHAHDTGRAYYAHQTAWVPLANSNEIPRSTDDLAEGTSNLYYTNARVAALGSIANTASNLVQRGADSEIFTGSIVSSAQKNYIRAHWDTLADLETEAPATDFHGMFAHAHDTGRAYYAHSNAWVPLANQSDHRPSAARTFSVSTSGSNYSIADITGDNPEIHVLSGHTYAFALDTSGHPFEIRESDGGEAISKGMVHLDGTSITSGAAANNGRESGTLYWTVPYDIMGSTEDRKTVVYQCQVHPEMIGNIVIINMQRLLMA